MFDELIARIRLEVDDGIARQDRSRATRSCILEEALRIFSERGYDGASTRDIAVAACVNQGLVTYYFGTKQLLWRAAVDKALAKYRNTFADRMAVLDDPNDREFFRFALKQYVLWACENANIVSMLFATDRAGLDRARWYSERHHRPFYDVWTSLIEHGQTHGIIRAGPVLNIYYLLATSASVFATAEDVKLMSDTDVSDPKFIDAHANLLFDMLVI